MCLPNFERFVDNETALGIRNWKISIKGEIKLYSEYQDFEWSNPQLGTILTENNSGLYSYNYHYYYNNYNYSNYHYYNNYNNYNNYHYYYISGIIKHFGKIAVHSIGYRSENAEILAFFKIREIDAKGSNDFLNWIKVFNNRIDELAGKFNVSTLTYQNFFNIPLNRK